MKIRHEQWGEVDGVDYYQLSKHWQKTVNGAHMVYYAHDGWSEVREPQYVDVTGEVGVIEVSEFNTQLCVGPHTLILPKGYHVRTREWFDLPPYCENAGYEQFDDFGLWVKKFKKPCLTIEKEQS